LIQKKPTTTTKTKQNKQQQKKLNKQRRNKRKQEKHISGRVSGKKSSHTMNCKALTTERIRIKMVVI